MAAAFSMSPFLLFFLAPLFMTAACPAFAFASSPPLAAAAPKPVVPATVGAAAVRGRSMGLAVSGYAATGDESVKKEDFSTQADASGRVHDKVQPVQDHNLSAEPDLGLPHGSTVFLNNQRLNAQGALAISSSTRRLAASIKLARILLALGMGPEASGVLENSASDTASAGRTPLMRGLLAVASIESHRRPKDIDALRKEAENSKEFAFWYGVGLAEQGDTVAAGKLLSDQVELVKTYSKPLQEFLAPLVGEELMDDNQLNAAQTLVTAMPNQHGLDLVRAELLEATDQRAEALAAYENLTHSGNYRIAGIATTRMIIVRYEMKKLSPKQAAKQLERSIYAWRGPRQELSIRTALAGIMGDSGNWLQAFYQIRNAKELFPAHSGSLDKERITLFNRLLASHALEKMKPLERVSLLQNCHDLIPPGPDGVLLLASLAKGLLQLDLPKMAAPVLKEILNRRPPPSVQADTLLTLARIGPQAGGAVGIRQESYQVSLEKISQDAAGKHAANNNSHKKEPVLDSKESNNKNQHGREKYKKKKIKALNRDQSKKVLQNALQNISLIEHLIPTRLKTDIRPLTGSN